MLLNSRNAGKEQSQIQKIHSIQSRTSTKKIFNPTKSNNSLRYSQLMLKNRLKRQLSKVKVKQINIFPINAVKKIMLRRRQLWQWRWARKSTKVWKNFRYLFTVKFNTRPYRVFSNYKRQKGLLNFLSWKYSLSHRNLIREIRTLETQNKTQLIVLKLFNALYTRWDSLLEVLKVAKNLTNARQLILSGRVYVNGSRLTTINKLAVVGDVMWVVGLSKKPSPNSILANHFEYNSVSCSWVMFRTIENNTALVHQDPILARYLQYMLTNENIIKNLISS